MSPLCQYNIGRNLLSRKNQEKDKQGPLTLKTQTHRKLFFAYLIERRNMRPLSQCNIGQNYQAKKGEKKNKK